jgi:hypothetical protein
MPAVAAHYYFGQRVEERLPGNIAAMIKRHQPVFDLGLQGPDLLFYYNPARTNPVSSLGIAIHSQIASGRIAGASAALRKEWDEAACCYLLGYVCHFTLDSSFHGDIAVAAPRIIDHFLLESELDRQVILKHYAKKPTAFKRHNLVKTRLKTYDCLIAVYPELTQAQLQKCARGFVFYLKVLYSPANVKKRIVKIIERTIGKANFFSALSVPDKANKIFYNDAKTLFSRMADLEEKGAGAVMNVVEHIRGNAQLSDIFQRNFE